MTIEQVVEEPILEAPVEPASSGLVGAAAIIGIGNVASRILGLVRETVIAYLFGATGYVSVFRVAATLIQTLYDFLVGGMVSAALVPVFSDFAARENKEDLWRVASVIINVLAVALASAVLVLEIFAPQLVWILGSGYDPALQEAAVQMVRLVLPAVFFLGVSGVVTGLLYSLKRFAYPAFTTAVYNLGIVLVALALSPIFGITSLIVGIIVGSALQVGLQLPGLRDMHYRFAIDFSHPALRKILRLYAPVVAGLSIMVVGVAIDRNLASHTGDQSLAWMQDATTLTQLPLGLVATAISFAILPELSRQSSVVSGGADSNIQTSNSKFQQTLAFGIKLVLLLIIPAAIGLFVLAHPIVGLLFEHGAFTANDTLMTSTALRFYLLGLPFAAIDQPLVFAFYSRKNTLAPNLVAFAGVAIYIVVALTLVQSLGMIGLVIANSAQLTGHALIMLWLTQTRLGGLGRQGVVALLAKSLLASAAMGAIAFAALSALGHASHLWQVVVPAAAAGVVYVVLLRLLRVREAERAWQIVLARVRR
jgi:putative peptidoglycan lipid II flippase